MTETSKPKRQRIRWGDNDRYWGPFTYSRDTRGYRSFAMLLQLKHVEQAIYERDALRAEVERLRGALTVLVAPANGYDGIPPRKYFGDTDFELRYPDDLIIEVQLGALRKARASLNGGKTDG